MPFPPRHNFGRGRPPKQRTAGYEYAEAYFSTHALDESEAHARTLILLHHPVWALWQAQGDRARVVGEASRFLACAYERLTQLVAYGRSLEPHGD